MSPRKPSGFLVISAPSVGSCWLKRCFLPLVRAVNITSIKVTPDDLVKYVVVKSQPLSCLKKDEFSWEVVQCGAMWFLPTINAVKDRTLFRNFLPNFNLWQKYLIAEGRKREKLKGVFYLSCTKDEVDLKGSTRCHSPTRQTFRSSLVTSDIAVRTLPSIDHSKINHLYTSNIVLAMVRSVLDCLTLQKWNNVLATD
jgi:hypothetical protein